MKNLHPLFYESAILIIREQLASVSMLQRRLAIDHQTAELIMSQLEAEKIVGPFAGDRQRDVIKKKMVEVDHYKIVARETK